LASLGFIRVLGSSYSRKPKNYYQADPKHIHILSTDRARLIFSLSIVKRYHARFAIHSTINREEKYQSLGFAQTDALSKLLIEKGIITQQEFLTKIAEERATYQRMLNPTRQ
jgi:hypothetical protein